MGVIMPGGFKVVLSGYFALDVFCINKVPEKISLYQRLGIGSLCSIIIALPHTTLPMKLCM